MKLQTLIIATDLTGVTPQLMDAAQTLLPLKLNRVILLHVIPPPTSQLPMVSAGGGFAMPLPIDPVIEQAHKDREIAAQAELASLLGELAPNVPVSIQVVIGNSPALICEVAEKENADLILMASHGHGLVHRVILGSTAEYVVNHAPCAVMVLRPHGTKPAAAAAKSCGEPVCAINPLPASAAIAC